MYPIRDSVNRLPPRSKKNIQVFLCSPIPFLQIPPARSASRGQLYRVAISDFTGSYEKHFMGP
jgi:hypothetical protein